MQRDISRAVPLIRLMVGSVFLAEGIQKFLYADALGAGRFARIGIPSPELMAPFVGVVEILFGSLLIIGFLTRLASLPLLLNILTAIILTKVPFLMKNGVWPAVHESRVDYCMVLGLLFLLVSGGGSWSVDRRLNAGKHGTGSADR